MRKTWVSLKESLSRKNLKQQHTSTDWALKEIRATRKCGEYSIINSFSEIAYIMPVSYAWSERGGSAIKRIETTKRNTLKSDALNALLMISLNGPQLEHLKLRNW